MNSVEGVRCLIVDDSADFVDAARGLLQCQGVTVVGVATNGSAAVRCLEQLRPDVALVDVFLGDESGFDLAEQLHRAALPSPVILISTHDAQDFAEMITASPALGFLSKSMLSCAAILDLLGCERPG